MIRFATSSVSHSLYAMLVCALVAVMQGSTIADEPTYESSRLPKGHEYFELRDGLKRCQHVFEQEKSGRVAFLGGSITESPGWRDLTIEFLKSKFPETKFDFISAGVASLGSVPHSFRLERDVLSNGRVDLLIVEAAVNDATNIPDRPDQMLRGMEGIVRHMRRVNPNVDIVHLHFAMPEHLESYAKGQTPKVIEQHERVATTYGNPSLNLAIEVFERIEDKQFTWADDFKDLHPSPFGHQLYANSIQRLFNAAFAATQPTTTSAHAVIEKPIDAFCYEHGRLGSIMDAKILRSCTLDLNWRPIDQKATRRGFVDVPALIAKLPGAEFEYAFEGRAIGLFITSGPDADVIQYSIDGGEYRSIDTKTQWSQALHLPWALILDDQLENGKHVLRVRTPSFVFYEKGSAVYFSALPIDRDKGSAVRVFHMLVN